MRSGTVVNIVFDLGGVVFNWQPDAIIGSVFSDPETQRLVKTEIFGHSDWVALDRGTLAIDQAIARGAARTGLQPSDVERLLHAVPASLTPRQETIELIRSASKTGNRLYVLSNMHLASIAYLEEKHEIWEMFDGVVISSRIHKVKPELAIYEYLLAEHNIDAADTVFIDDMDENLAAASSIGIQTIKFLDASQCRKALSNLNCL